MIFSSDLGSPEGPVLMPDGSWLVVEMAPERGCVTHISADGQSKRIIARTGRPNGLALDRTGHIWVAESREPALLRVSLEGAVEVYLASYEGERFLFPNDLAFGPDGALYMTDSGIRFQDFAPRGVIRPDWATLKTDGRVYAIDVQHQRVQRLDSGLGFANGIAFGPDGDLYVNETLTGLVYRYSAFGGGEFGTRQTFGDVVDRSLPPAYRGPDGMKFGLDGNLYCTVYGQGDVTVLGPSGAVVRRIQTHGQNPTNLAFGPAGQKTIYVTEVQHGTLEAHVVGTDGLPLHRG
jgi:gluconolactonase